MCKFRGLTIFLAYPTLKTIAYTEYCAIWLTSQKWFMQVKKAWTCMIFSRSSLHHFITPQWVLPINEKHDLCSREISIFFFSSYEIKLALWNKSLDKKGTIWCYQPIRFWLFQPQCIRKASMYELLVMSFKNKEKVLNRVE